MSELIKWLDGNKTHLCGAAYAFVVIAAAQGWLSPEVAEAIKGVLLGTGLVMLRLGVAKIPKLVINEKK